MQVSGLFIYPVKGLRGLELTSFELGPRGPLHDRAFMLVDSSGRFLTQRTMPELARFETAIEGHVLRIAREGSTLEVPLAGEGHRREVTIWQDRVPAIDCGDEAADWFSRTLAPHPACRLVRVADEAHRRLDPKYVPDPKPHTAFADGYPVLMTHEASLAELNSRLTSPVPMGRFRPNIVVRGDQAPWAEDEWRDVRVGELVFDSVKPCARCVVITTDQLTGELSASSEPLRTLASYRALPGLGALFGINLVPRAHAGTVRLGDPVVATSRGAR